MSQTVFAEEAAPTHVGAAQAAIDIVDLRKTYGQREVLHGLSLRVAPGEVFGFLGPNGAGKSTTMKILAGLVRPSSGDARVFGLQPTESNARGRIGYLPEQFRFHRWLTAIEVLQLHGRLAGLESARICERIPIVLEEVGLTDRGSERLQGYSKGMTQRIGIAQAMLHQPDLLLLDEPTSALDPVGRREVRNLIRLLASRGMAVFVNSHLLTEIELTCDRVAIVDQGRVVRMGSVAELMEGRRRLRVDLDRLDDGIIARLERFGLVERTGPSSLAIELNPVSAAPDVASDIVMSGYHLHGLATVQDSLEDLFVRLVEPGDR
ncbi:MAG TPA: ABC transporter ATP-binding protein [Chloroflexota bacterium]|nr:ABC transporter ATP-binding protein [Chloroflexota bacterium]